MDGKKRAAGRELADLLAAYGVNPLGRPLSYEEYVGLVQNVPRQRLRRAAEVADGIAGALSADDPGPEWADALASCPAEAEDLRFRMVAERLSARTRARLGR